jgi:hypothetical protein
MHDDQLREQFTTWARPLQAARPPAVPVLRRRARRRTAVRGVAVSALGVLGAAAVIAVSGHPRASHVHSVTPTVHGVPRYAVVLQHGGQAAAVLDMSTGKVLGRVAMPGAHADFLWVAAAADDRTFVLAGQPPPFTDRFYMLHLGASGKPGQLAPLNVPPLRGAQISGMALTADASKLAVAWLPPSYLTGPAAGRISVTTLSTGATRTWSSAHGSASTVSWAGDHTLAFTWQDASQEAQSGVRLLNTGAVGTSLLASRLLLPASVRVAGLSSPGNPVVTQDGSTVFATMAFGTRTAIVRFSARSGEFLEVLVPPVRSGASPGYCGVLWTDPHGRHLLAQCGPLQASIEGNRPTRVHLHYFFPPSPVGFSNTFAW